MTFPFFYLRCEKLFPRVKCCDCAHYECEESLVEVFAFAECLVAVSRLDFLNEHRAADEVVADNVVRRILSDAGLEVKRKHKLSITNDRSVSVDCFSEQRWPSAIQIL